MPAAPLPTILDCDPGHDDVVAILLAAAHTDLRAITTVAGNAPLERTTANTLVAATIFGLDVPVHAGAVAPLLVEPYAFPQIHGESGLDGPALPPPTSLVQEATAVERILLESRRTAGLWLIATGPLTNVALALRADPALAARLAGISMMGGGIGFGNVTPGAEYNIWHDPEAAAIVFASGARILMCPLDVTHQVLVDAAFTARIRALGTPVAAFLGDLFRHFADAYADVFFGRAVGPLHDPCAVLALTHPDLFTFEDLHVEIGLAGAARGVTIADRRTVKDRRAPNARVALAARADAVLEVVAEAVRSLP